MNDAAFTLKAILRSSISLDEKLSALTGVGLFTDDPKLFALTERFRGLLCKKDSNGAKIVPRGKKTQDKSKLPNKKRSNEMDNAQNGLNEFPGIKEIDLDEWRERVKKEREARGMR